MSGEVELLAREIGAVFRRKHETVAFQARWAAALAVLVGDHLECRSRYPADIARWVARIGDAVDGDMMATLDAVRDEISYVDSDDGWATDEAGAGLEMACLSLQTGTRWMAHAAADIWGRVTGAGVTYNDVVKISRDAWLRHLYDRCANGAG